MEFQKSTATLPTFNFFSISNCLQDLHAKAWNWIILYLTQNTNIIKKHHISWTKIWQKFYMKLYENVWKPNFLLMHIQVPINLVKCIKSKSGCFRNLFLIFFFYGTYLLFAWECRSLFSNDYNWTGTICYYEVLNCFLRVSL